MSPYFTGNQLFIFSLFAKQLGLQSKLLCILTTVWKVKTLCFRYAIRMTKRLSASNFYAVSWNQSIVFVLRKLKTFFDPKLWVVLCKFEL